MTESYVEQCTKAQEALCDEYNLPMFAPSTGYCFSCGRLIYTDDEKSFGITLDEAGRRFISSCPYCNRSYCD